MMVVGLLEPPAASMGTQAETREVVVPFSYSVSARSLAVVCR